MPNGKNYAFHRAYHAKGGAIDSAFDVIDLLIERDRTVEDLSDVLGKQDEWVLSVLQMAEYHGLAEAQGKVWRFAGK